MREIKHLGESQMQNVTTKPVDILYRVVIKASGIIVYVVLSSDGVTRYNVTVIRGKVNSCSCPSYKPCRHMKAVQEREDARKEQEAQAPAIAPVVTSEYAAPGNQPASDAFLWWNRRRFNTPAGQAYLKSLA